MKVIPNMDIRNLTISICGGGNLGSVCAGIFLSQGIKVNLLTGHPDNWSKKIVVIDTKGKSYSGEFSIISSNAEEVIVDSDIVLLCVPGYLIERTLREIKPFIKESTLIGSVVSCTGFFFKAHSILNRNTKLFGFQRAPFISRYNEYGKTANLLGYKNELKVAIEGPKKEETRQLLENIFLTPVSMLNNYFEASLTNSNPILHTGRLFSLWENYTDETYDNPILFYSDWNDDASEIVISMDEEFMCLVQKLGISNKAIPSLLDYYESSDKHTLTARIKSIQAFKNITAPMKQKDDVWIPDFNSRYFTEDFPFGLQYIKELAMQHNVKTSIIDKVYAWGISKI